MLSYITQVICFQAIFIAVYYFLLRKETFFQNNRYYLLATVLVSFIIPMIKISFLETAVPVEAFQTWLPEVIIGDNQEAKDEVMTNQGYYSFPWLTVYLLGVVISIFLLYSKINKLLFYFKFKQSGENIIEIPASKEAFTLFNCIFIGKDIDPLSRKRILAHELIHVKQKHTWDLILFEFLRLVMWFNPFIYIYQKETSIVHEYLADQKAITLQPKSEYFEQLLNAAFGTQNLSFTNTFFNQSLIKKRISMLQKSKSKKIALIKYTLVFPMVFLMLVQNSLAQEKSKVQESNFNIFETNFNKDRGAYSLVIKDLKKISSQESQFLDELRNSKTIDIKDISVDENNNATTLTPLDLIYIFSKNDLSNKLIKKYNMTIINSGEIDNDLKNGTNYKEGKNKTEIVEIDPSNLSEQADIPFAVISKIPVYPGCENIETFKEKKKCMSDAISRHVNSQFNIALGKGLGLEGVNRLFVSFRINKYGLVDNVQARAPHPALKKEAMRVIYSLPQMEPGKQKGIPVGVLYSLPITFAISE